MNQRRMITNGIFADEELSQLSLGARLLFIGMITNADDEGRLSINPKLLKAKVFPLDDDITSLEVHEFLEEIVQRLKSVVFYAVDGKTYAQFTKWSEYQTIRSDRKRDSKLPPPTTDNHLSTICQPTDNQNAASMRTDDGINEVNIKEVKGKEININAPSNDGGLENLINEQPSGGITQEFQYLGLQIFELTHAPADKKNECMRIAKIYNENHVMTALSFVKDYSGSISKWKMFVYKLNELHKAAKQKEKNARTLVPSE